MDIPAIGFVIVYPLNYHMKKIASILFIALATTKVFSQTLPVTSGLVLNVDAAIGFDNVNHTWADQSGAGNNLVSIDGFPVATVVNGRNAVRFSTSLMNSATLNTVDSTEGSIFIVSANASASALMASVSIAKDVRVEEEMVIESSEAYHHSAPSQWVGRPHQCIISIPANAMMLTSAIFKTSPKAIDLYINGLASTSLMDTFGVAQNFISTPRRIYLGGRRYNTNTYIYHPYQGDIYAVLVYKRALNATEIASVNKYLRCKYAIDYAGCSSELDCKNVSVSGQAPGTFNSFDCHPNPATANFQITYSLKDNYQTAGIIITDISGREVKSINLSGNRKGVVNISEANLTDGMYFYSLIADGIIIGTKKMLISK